MKYLTVVVLVLLSVNLYAEPAGDCKGTPKSAVTLLPEPLNSWGRIVCTPYGHIIRHQQNWIWSNPGSYSPVRIPSQMVRSNPKPLANESYFTEIVMSELTGIKAEASIKLFESGFDASESIPKVYSLRVVSVSGKTLGFNFYDYGDTQWGMWCNTECDPNSRFMLLDLGDRRSNPSKTIDGS